MCLAPQIGLVLFPVGALLGNPALSVPHLCHFIMDILNSHFFDFEMSCIDERFCLTLIRDKTKLQIIFLAKPQGNFLSNYQFLITKRT